MNAFQIIVLLFALIVIAIDVWAIVAIARAPGLRFKSLWIIGSLVGFIGLGIDWSQPDDLIVLIGITVPVVTWFAVAGHIIVKTGFPVVAVAALAKIGNDRKT